MLNIEYANKLAKRLPLLSCEVCTNHPDGVHIHLLCKCHGKVISDFLVEDGVLIDTEEDERYFGPENFLLSCLMDDLEDLGNWPEFEELDIM